MYIYHYHHHQFISRQSQDDELQKRMTQQKKAVREAAQVNELPACDQVITVIFTSWLTLASVKISKLTPIMSIKLLQLFCLDGFVLSAAKTNHPIFINKPLSTIDCIGAVKLKPPISIRWQCDQTENMSPSIRMYVTRGSGKIFFRADYRRSSQRR